MSDIAAMRATGFRKAGSALMVLLFVAPLATAAAPRLTWLFLLLLAGGLLIGFWRQGGNWRQLLRPNPAFLAVLVVVLYAFISATWSPEPGATLGKAALLLGAVLLTLAASNAIAVWDKTELRQASLAFAAGAFLGALYLLIGILTGNAVQRAAEFAVTIDSPEGKNSFATKFKLGSVRRNVTMLVLHLWPALLVLTAFIKPSRRLTYTLLFLAAVAVPVFLSGRESAQVALIGSALVFVAASTWRRGMSRGLAAAWCLAFALILPLTFAAYRAELHMEEWLPKSARARVILWEYTAERVLETPWIGIGGDATPLMREGVTPEQPEGFVYPRTTGAHAHSLFLQVWYELGLVGAVLVALAGAATALRTTSLSPEAQPFAAATFATFGASVAFAWGIWQTWLICGVALALLYLLIAAHAATGPPASARSGQTGSSAG
jgi:O-antigen ligase